MRSEPSKKNEWLNRKPLDKPHKVCYTMSVLKERDTTKCQVSVEKKFLKKPKKVLDKLPTLWYNKNVNKRCHLSKSRKELIL